MSSPGARSVLQLTIPRPCRSRRPLLTPIFSSKHSGPCSYSSVLDDYPKVSSIRNCAKSVQSLPFSLMATHKKADRFAAGVGCRPPFAPTCIVNRFDRALLSSACPRRILCRRNRYSFRLTCRGSSLSRHFDKYELKSKKVLLFINPNETHTEPEQFENNETEAKPPVHRTGQGAHKKVSIMGPPERGSCSESIAGG